MLFDNNTLHSIQKEDCADYGREKRSFIQYTHKNYDVNKF